MINANELRIGNWLQFEDDDGWVNLKVIAIGHNMDGYKGYSVHFNGRSCTIEDRHNDGDLSVKPIPLTEEILLKAEFIHAPNLDDNAFVKKIILWDGEAIIRVDHFCVNEKWYFVVSVCELEGEYLYDGNKLQDLKTENIKKEITIQEIDYVHQLQNIHYSLTNEELQINL